MFWLSLIAAAEAVVIAMLVMAYNDEERHVLFWFQKYAATYNMARLWKLTAKKYYKLNKSLTSKYNWEAKN